MAKSLFDLREAWETKKGIEIKRKANTDVEEAAGKFTDKQIKMAYGIINDPRWKSGNMTSIVRRIEDIAKGLSKHSGVQKALRVTNEEKEPASPDEGSMALRQLEFMSDAIEDIMDHIEESGDFPEWMQNKLTEAHTNIKDLYAAVEGSEDDDDDN